MKSDINKSISNIAKYINDNVNALNDSKLFAGLMIITLNVASKFVTIKLSKTMESYLKYTFSKQILVFVIAWMGSRNIYIAVIITVIFIICMDYLFNEDSQFCCLPYTFTKYHIDRLENYENIDGDSISDEDIKKAESILEKAKKQQKPTIQDTQKSGYTNY